MAEFVELWDLVSVVQLVDREDTISWGWTPDGCYSAKSAYSAQFEGSHPPFNTKSIWRARAEGKHRFFTWLLIQAKILTVDKLLQRNWPCNPVCSLCDQQPETALHLCVLCPFALEIWSLVKSWAGDCISLPTPGVQTMQHWWKNAL